MKNKKGYISVESVILIGLLITLAFTIIAGLLSRVNIIKQNQTNTQIVEHIQKVETISKPKDAQKQSLSHTINNFNYDIAINIIANIISGALTTLAIFNYKKIIALFTKNKKKDIS